MMAVMYGPYIWGSHHHLWAVLFSKYEMPPTELHTFQIPLIYQQEKKKEKLSP